MAYDTNVLRRASQRLEEDRRRREEELQVRQTDAYRRLPRLRELDRRIQGTMSGLLAAALRRGESSAQALQASFWAPSACPRTP